MIFTTTPLAGLYVVRPTRYADERGFFARLWCETAFAEAGCLRAPVQVSTSFNHRRGTMRGLHWQAAPHAEAKLVRPVQGRIFDVAVDLRGGSPTWGAWFGMELDAAEGTGLLIPKGFAHGFLTLCDDAEVLYVIEGAYRPDVACGACWNDPLLGIAWPFPPVVIAARDQQWPLLERISNGG